MKAVPAAVLILISAVAMSSCVSASVNLSFSSAPFRFIPDPLISDPLISDPATRQETAPQTLFELTNKARLAAGLRPLKWGATLAAVAVQHAERMAEAGAISHQFPGEPDPPARARVAGARFRRFAENVGEGPGAEEIYEGWMRSPPHRATIVDPQLTMVGIGVTARNNQFYAVQDFSAALEDLSLEEQQKQVNALLKSRGLQLLEATAEAQKACEDEDYEIGPARTGRGQSGAAFLVRYTSTDLSKFPEAFDKQIRNGKYHAAASAACSPAGRTGFALYQVAIILYE